MTDDNYHDKLDNGRHGRRSTSGLAFYDVASFRSRTLKPIPPRRLRAREVGDVTGPDAAPPAMPLRHGHALVGSPRRDVSPAPTSALRRSAAARELAAEVDGSRRASSNRSCTSLRPGLDGRSDVVYTSRECSAGCPTSVARRQSWRLSSTGGFACITEITRLRRSSTTNVGQASWVWLSVLGARLTEKLSRSRVSDAGSSASTPGLTRTAGTATRRDRDRSDRRRLRLDFLHEFDFVGMARCRCCVESERRQ